MTDKKPAAAPDFGQLLGAMYERWTLDCVVTIGHAVSLDFSDQPQLYTSVSTDTATKLTKLQGDYGFQADFPDMNIRQRLMKPIFGQSDGHGSGNDGSDFQQKRLNAVVAAAKFSESGQLSGVLGLFTAIRNTSVELKNHLSIGGTSLSQTEARMTGIFEVAQSILKDPTVSARFGINTAIDPKWPLESRFDMHGAQLIENITKALPALLPYGIITHQMFEHIQQTADDGFEPIRIILDEDITSQGFKFDPLAAALYGWGSDLRLVGGPGLQQQPPGPPKAAEPAGATQASPMPATSITAPAGIRGYQQ
jgi:hypothetical protein